MKKILLLALIATTFFACSNEGNEVVQETKPKSLEFTLGVATPKTRMADGTVDGATASAVRTGIESITIEYFNSSDVSLGTYNLLPEQIAIVKSDNQTQQESDRKPVRLNDIPGSTAKVNVYLNVKSQKDINDLQTSYNVMEYCSATAVGIQLVGAGQGTDGNDLYKVEVPVKPVMTRFEFTGKASDIVVNKIGGTLPNNITDGNKTDAQKHVSDATIAAAEKAARDAWKAAHPGVTDPDPWEYKYTVKFAYNTAYTITDITGYYMNNIPLTKGSSTLVLNANDANGDWDTTAKSNYSENGKMKKMFDESAPGTGKVIAYNLFPQTAINSGATITDVKTSMPHFILKLTVDQAPTTRWLTIRALRTTDASDALVTSFEAGKVYILKATDITINQYTANLTVTASGTAGPEIPEIIDPVDPNPEPVGKDLDVLVKIMDWETVYVKPEW